MKANKICFNMEIKSLKGNSSKSGRKNQKFKTLKSTFRMGIFSIWSISRKTMSSSCILVWLVLRLKKFRKIYTFSNKDWMLLWLCNRFLITFKNKLRILRFSKLLESMICILNTNFKEIFQFRSKIWFSHNSQQF